MMRLYTIVQLYILAKYEQKKTMKILLKLNNKAKIELIEKLIKRVSEFTNLKKEEVLKIELKNLENFSLDI